jgi:membrane protease YdiL (CAAX protease family)
MKKYFINPETGLFRAGWRIVLFMIVFIAITFVVMSGVRAALGGLKGGGLLQFTLLGITATIAVYIARKYFDKKSLVSLGVKWDKYAALDILSGFLNSALVMAGIFFVMLWADLIEFRGFSWWMDSTDAAAAFSVAAIPVILVVLFKLTLVSWWEELVFRGYILQNIISGTSLLWAIVITSVLFGAIHAGNPGATTLSTFLLVITTPQLIYAYVKTGQLWLPMGIHLGWNFFQSSVFGYAASGMDSPTMISQVPVAADWLSGGEFGAEGSVLVIPFTFLSLFLIHFWVRATRKPGQGVFETLV